MTRVVARMSVTLGLLALVPPGAGAAQQDVTSKIEQVLVYSTQARVYQGAWTKLNGKEQEVPLLDLPTAVRLESVRVTSKTADVVRVQVAQTRGKLPRQAKTEELVNKIEKVMDELQDLRHERQVLHSELSFIAGLTLRREPERDKAPADGLFADVWRRILTWMDGRAGRARARLNTLARKHRELQQALHKLQVEGQALDLGDVNQPVQRVIATLKGRAGKHKVTVSYLVDSVRWVPSYDLRYNASRRVVEATYYAVVSQSTGEDWDKVKLRFSTAMPTRLLAIPELPTLTLGRRRDFMPTPRPHPDPAPRPWQPPAPEVPTDPMVQHLRGLLQASVDGDRPATGEKAGEGRGMDRDGDAIPDAQDQCPTQPEVYNGYADQDGCPDRGRVRVPRVRPGAAPKKAAPRRRSYVRDEADDMEYEAAPAVEPAAPPPAPASARPRLQAEGTAISGALSGGSVWGKRAYTPTEGVPWSDEGYRPPQVHRDLPAAAAEGYRFTLYAPGTHSVPASGERQRVPVLREELKVRPYYHVAAGASKNAYLMAEVKNTTGRPILRGHANLFTGDMFSGRSWLNTSLPGEKIKLPLGVDDAVKVERNARQRTVSQGMIFKDDISEYTVEIELANHHRYPVEVEVRDQVPVKQGRKIEVKSFSATPKMDKPDKDGMVSWKGKVKASSVKKLKFTYQIVRPKDWELRQHDG